MTKETQELLAVTLADRAAASEIARVYAIHKHLDLEILEAKTDGSVLVQAFARHREASLSSSRIEVETLRAQIAWILGEPPKEDGAVVYGHTWSPYRWKAYSTKSEQFRRGIKGRWQRMNEYAGWDNAPAPDEWATEEAINARRAALDATS